MQFRCSLPRVSVQSPNISGVATEHSVQPVDLEWGGRDRSWKQYVHQANSELLDPSPNEDTLLKLACSSRQITQQGEISDFARYLYDNIAYLLNHGHKKLS